MKIIALILLSLIILTLTVYDIKLNSDGYDILLRNRFTKLGFGIDYKDGLQIWHFARTVHGGRAEKPLYPSVIEFVSDNLQPVRVIKADFNSDRIQEIVTLKQKDDEKLQCADYDLEIVSKGKTFLIKDVIMGESPAIRGLEKITISPKISPFIGVSYHCGMHSWGLDLYSFNGKQIKEAGTFGSDAPSIQLKDVDNDGVNEIIEEGRDWDSDNSIKDSIIYTHKYNGNEWELISKYETRTKKYIPISKQNN